MARRVRIRAGSVVKTGPQVAAPVVTDDEDAVRRYPAVAVQVNGLEATITVQIPSGKTTLLVKPPFGLSEQYAVTGGQSFSFGFRREAPAADEHPKMRMFIGFPGETDFPVDLNFTREVPDEPDDPIPVTLLTAGSVATSGIVGGSVNTSAPGWGGDVSAVENFHFTGETLPYTSTSTIFTTIPNLVGTVFRLGSRAYGPTADDPNVNDWTDWVYTDPIEIMPVPAARRLLSGDITILRSVYRPNTGQTTYFTPIMAFPGLDGETVHEIDFTAADLGNADPTWHTVTETATAGEWALFDNGHPVATPTADAGLFSVGNPRNSRLRFRWRGAADQPWSETSVVLTVPAPVTPVPVEPLKTIFKPTQATVQTAIATSVNADNANFGNGPYQNYKIQNYGRNGHGNPSVALYSKWSMFIPMISAWAGDNYTVAVGGVNKAVVEHMVDQLLRWANDAGDTAPYCRSGYHGQHEMQFVCIVAMARITPAVWDHTRLNAAAKYKTRLRLLMKAMLVSSAWVTSPTRPAGWTGYTTPGGQRTIPGYSAGHSNVPNFSSPPRLTPHVVAAFMAEDEGNVNAARDFLNAFDRDTFSAELEAVGGINDCRAVFKQDWTKRFQHERYGNTAFTGTDGATTVNPQWSTIGVGPTKAQLHAALRPNGGSWRSVTGHNTAQSLEAFVLELRERTFSKRIKPGVLNVEKPAGTAVGEAGPADSGWTEDLYGIKYGTETGNRLRACVGKAITVNGLPSTDKSQWATIPYPGEWGLPEELDTTDGPLNGAQGPARRSSVSYCASGLGATMLAFVTMICYGKFSPTDPLWLDAKNRFQAGIAYMDHIAVHGYLSYAKGGLPNASNEDWTPEFMVAQRVKWPAFMAMMDMVADWWGLDPF